MKFDVSSYNANGIAQELLTRGVFLCDVTARDGEQTVGVSFSKEEKMELARRLDALGVGQIQLHAAGVSKDQYDEAKAICALGLNADIEILNFLNAPNWKDQVKAAIDCGADVVHALIPVSPRTRNFYDRLTDEQTVERARQYVNFAKEQGAPAVNLNMLDCPRGGEAFLDDLITACVREGIDRMRVNDTVGTATPQSVSYLVHKAKRIVRENNAATLIGAHCHNDFGLATANTIAAILAGADFADVSVNGLGERAGNAAMAEVAVSLKALYGIDCGLKHYTMLQELSDYVAAISGVAVPNGKPLVGAHVFSDQSDRHNTALAKDVLSFQGITAESVGNKRRILIGRGVGPYTLGIKLAEQGMALEESKHDAVVSELKAAAKKKKGEPLTDQEFRQIVAANGGR